MDRQKSIHQLEARIRENPNSLVFARLADLYIQEKRIDEAINLCLKGLKTHTGYITGNFVLGKAFLAKGDFERAEAEFKKVLTYDRSFLHAHKTLGDLMSKMGWENKALMHYRDLISLDPMEEETRQIVETLNPSGKSESGEAATEISVSDSPEEGTDSSQWINELEEVFQIDEKPPSGTPESQEASQDVLQDTIEENEPLNLEFEETGNSGIEPENIKAPETVSPVETTENDFPLGDIEELNTDKPLFEFEEEKHPAEPDKELQEEPSIEENPLFAPDSSVFSGDEAAEDKPLFPEEKTEEPIPPEPETESPMETGMIAPSGEENLLSAEDLVTEDDLNSEDPSTPPAPKNPHLENEIKETILELTENEIVEEPDLPETAEEDQAPVEGTSQSAPASEPSGEEEFDVTPGQDKKIVSSTLGEIYAAQGQYDKALQVYEELLSHDPQNKKYQDKIQELKRKAREAGL